ncbi:hypothetical protein [Amycolatopsis thailandensis]|uniref:hypothetical protein n=1 Tax=Amycolatopsis thailandensis TaxID=589330 RepID=UPI0036360A7B
MRAPGDLISEIPVEQEMLLRAIFDPAEQSGRWPTWQYVDRTCAQAGMDAMAVFKSLPVVRPIGAFYREYGLVRYDDQVIRDETVVRLTMAAALHLPEFEPVGEDFVHSLHVMIDAIKHAPVDPYEVKPVVITKEDLEEGGRGSIFYTLMPDLLRHEPMPFSNNTGHNLQAGTWSVTLNGEVLRRLDGVTDLAGYVRKAVQWIDELPGDGNESEVQRLVPLIAPRPSYVDEALIDKLEAAQAVTKWNLKKLLQLLRELNENYRNEAVYACHALLRMILDHVPPIFGQPNFGSVTSQYKPRSSDKKYSENLENFRLQADDAMHRQARQREDILHFDDLPPRTWVKWLIAEVVAVLDAEAP